MITSTLFGTHEGQPVQLFTLKNASGAFVEVMEYGCAIRTIMVPDRDGKLVDVALGYDTLEEYTGQNGCLGACIGRHANRIGGAVFTLGGKTYPLAVNNGPNNLHGGVLGFDKRVWNGKIVDDTVVFSRTSPDGEEGFPGTLDAKITFAFSDDNALRIRYEAASDADTVVSMTNHSYFNLDGHAAGSVYDHLLTVFADEFCENDANCLPTGKILQVEGTPFDFRTEKAIGRDIEVDDINLKNGTGYDHNFVLKGDGMKTAAVCRSEKSGITLTVDTEKPGVQLYTANFLTKRAGKGGATYTERTGFCLETQLFPNALNHPHFPSPILKKGDRYDTTTAFQFGVK